MSRFPCVTLYTFQDITSEITESLNRITASLGSKGLPQSNIEIVHLGDDRELAKRIVENCPAKVEKWPLVYIDAKAIGTEQDLDNWLLLRGDFQVIPENINSPITFYAFKNTSLIPTGVVQLVENLDKKYRELRQQYSVLLSNNQTTEAATLRNEIQELRNQIEKILQQNSTTSSSCEEYSPKIDISLLINLSPHDANEDGQIYDMVIEDEKEPEGPNEELDNDCVFPFEEDVDEFTSLPPSSENENDEISQSVVGQTISGVSSYFKSALNYVGLSPTQEGMDEVPIAKPVEPTDSLLAEFPVMQTNCATEQARVLRFYQSYFARVNPGNQEVRAVHEYVNLSKILKKGNTFTLQFTDAAPEDYASPNTSSIVELFTRLIKNLIVEGN